MAIRGARVGRPCKICQENCERDVEKLLLSGASNAEIIDFLKGKTGKVFFVQNIYNHMNHMEPYVISFLKVQKERRKGITSVDRQSEALDMLWQFIDRGKVKIFAEGHDTNTKDYVSSWLKALDTFFKHSELEEVEINIAYRKLVGEYQTLRYVLNNILTDEQRKIVEERLDEFSNVLEGEVVQNQLEGEQ